MSPLSPKFPFDSKTFNYGKRLVLHLYLSLNVSRGYTGKKLLLDCDTFILAFIYCKYIEWYDIYMISTASCVPGIPDVSVWCILNCCCFIILFWQCFEYSWALSFCHSTEKVNVVPTISEVSIIIICWHLFVVVFTTWPVFYEWTQLYRTPGFPCLNVFVLLKRSHKTISSTRTAIQSAKCPLLSHVFVRTV